MSSLLETITGALLRQSALGKQQRLSILIFHRVFAQRDWMRPGEPTAPEFAWQMQLLKRHFNVLPLYDAVQRLQQGNLPARAACVTFDDGYADNATVALPILQQYGIPATVFVAAGYLNGGRMWNDTVIEFLRQYTDKTLDLSHLQLPVYPTDTQELRRKAAHDIVRRCKYLENGRREEIATEISQSASSLPDSLMLTTEQLVLLHQQGIEIGGHTFSHPILSSLSSDQAREEITRGKRELEVLLNTDVRLFAYPNGRPDIDYKPEHVRLVQESGFEAAVATHWGVSDQKTNLFQLPRFTPWDKSAHRYLMRMVLNSRHVV